jgi:hypothetical protein
MAQVEKAWRSAAGHNGTAAGNAQLQPRELHALKPESTSSLLSCRATAQTGESDDGWPNYFAQPDWWTLRVESRGDSYPHGHTRRTILTDLIRSMRAHVVEQGLATNTELDELFAAAVAHLANPDVVVMPHLSFLVSGRKPT